MSGARTRTLVMLAAGAGAVALALIGAPSCSHSPPARAPKPSKEPATKKATRPPEGTATLAPAEQPTTNYADSIRKRQFGTAAKLIDAATATERAQPEVRYARALCALELGDVETAFLLSETLEKEAPLFLTEARELKERAARISQDVTLLVHFLGGSKGPEDQLLLAEAHEHNSNIHEARKIADDALVSLQKSKRSDLLELRFRAHQIKARTFAAEDMKVEAAREYHWLATDGASLDDAGEFDDQVEALDPSRALNQKERLARIEAFSKRGLVKQIEEEIEALKKLSPAAAASKNTDIHLAWAYYNSRSDYLKAAQLFASAAAHGGPDKKEHLYYEAKSLARSHRDQDAIAKYERVTALGGNFADHAAYQAAHLKFIDGRWSDAIKAYETYLKKFGKNAKHRQAIASELPIVRLAAGDFARAETELRAELKKESSERNRARLMELIAVAMLGAKKEAEAETLFRQVIEYRPLSLPALMAAARLASMGKSAPPSLAPARTLSDAEKSTPPLKLSLPEKAWRLSRVGLDEEAEEALRASEGLLRKQFGERSGEALCRLYGQLKSAKRRYQVAQTAASWSVLKEAPSPTTEWQWDCIYPTPYEDIVTAEAKKNDVSPSLLYGIMRQESAFRPTVVSPADAVGLMQIIPPTARKIATGLKLEYVPDLMRAPAINVQYGAYYVRYLMDIFENRAELVAASYNAGPQAVSRWLRAGQDLPLDIFVARIPYSETRNYVYRVMGNYARYAYREEGAEPLTINLELPKGIAVPADAY